MRYQMSISNDNIYFREAQGTTATMESSERTPNMGDGEIAAGKVLLERKFNRFWKHGSMFRPPTLSRPHISLSSSPSAEDHSEVTPCYGFKTRFKDHFTPYSPPLAFQNFVSQFCPEEQVYSESIFDLMYSSTFQVASHKGFLCIQGSLDPGDGIRKKSLIVCNLVKERVVKVLPSPDFNVGLMHMRVDDRGQKFKLLIAGGYDGQYLPHCTNEYDSKTDTWEPATENPDLPGSFKEYQNGAYYKDPKYDQEYLFCISTILDAMDSQKILMFDFKRKSWSRCEVPHITVNQGSDIFEPVGPINIEEYGRIIFLFSEHKCSEHVYIFIHKLNLDGVGNVTWEEVIRKKRSGEGQEKFLVYSSTVCFLSTDVITEAGGCIFAFSMEECGGFLCVHELNLSGSWGPAIRYQTPKQSIRSSNWTEEEKHGFLFLHLEALNLPVDQGPPWSYISQGLWEWGAFDRCPKSCSRQWDSLLKLYKKVFKQSKFTGYVNFDLGLNANCYNLMSEIFAVKKKIKDSSTPKATILPVANRKRIRSAEIHDTEYVAHHPASGARGPSSAGTLRDSTTLQPSTSGRPSSSLATVTPFVASTSQPSAAVEPSSTTVPLPASTAVQRHPSDERSRPSSSTANLPSSTCKVSDYHRAMKALRRNSQDLPGAQECELFIKSVELNHLKAELKNAKSKSGDVLSCFCEVIDVLQSSNGPEFTSSDCFKLLMKSLETDILETKTQLSKQLSEEQD